MQFRSTWTPFGEVTVQASDPIVVLGEKGMEISVVVGLFRSAILI